MSLGAIHLQGRWGGRTLSEDSIEDVCSAGRLKDIETKNVLEYVWNKIADFFCGTDAEQAKKLLYAIISTGNSIPHSMAIGQVNELCSMVSEHQREDLKAELIKYIKPAPPERATELSDSIASVETIPGSNLAPQIHPDAGELVHNAVTDPEPALLPAITTDLNKNNEFVETIPSSNLAPQIHPDAGDPDDDELEEDVFYDAPYYPMSNDTGESVETTMPNNNVALQVHLNDSEIDDSEIDGSEFDDSEIDDSEIDDSEIDEEFFDTSDEDFDKKLSGR